VEVIGQDGWVSIAELKLSWVWSLPSAFMTKISQSPSRSLAKAMGLVVMYAPPPASAGGDQDTLIPVASTRAVASAAKLRAMVILLCGISRCPRWCWPGR
jgi:hypothetical protein